MENQDLINRCNLIALQAVQLRELILGEEKEAAKASPVAIKRQAEGLCVYCGEEIEEGETHFRGAHQRCYKKVNRMLNSGTITEDIAIEKGWLLPRERGGRSMDAMDPIAKYLNEMMAGIEKPKRRRK